MINVIAVFQDFGISSTYFSYSNFGDFRIEELIWNKKLVDVFPDRMKNLHGITLPILFNGPEPGLIVAKTAIGNTIIGGYLWHILKAFAKKHNAKLNISNIETSLGPRDAFTLLVVNGTVEILGVFPLRLTFPANFNSYPFICYDWGVMVPKESKIPIYKELH
ncbi:uncharacterized protein LOC129919521 isoform X2 [Episyrphus balteatus]|uniref:uncharacterized protein LOC129919521 isoform X2 n=1 Tax=Episyrphus balteatus TaxID=286459 RepID=UPI002485846C|nr:uncharacterized protein LOC129919521 isoform X2 [Episyrphus balteatus]